MRWRMVACSAGRAAPEERIESVCCWRFLSSISAALGTTRLQNRRHTWKILRYGSQNLSKTNLISRKRVSVRNSARHLHSRESQSWSLEPGLPFETPSPAEDGVSGLEDGVVDDKVVGRELGGQLL